MKRNGENNNPKEFAKELEKEPKSLSNILHDVRCFHLTLNTGVIKILPYH
ncbi:MAG: hypothetical protein GH151_14645 [Bacteroidetes bacterium]|nr:hypothetical protein [Bacteroidota bacterium]